MTANFCSGLRNSRVSIKKQPLGVNKQFTANYFEQRTCTIITVFVSRILNSVGMLGIFFGSSEEVTKSLLDSERCSKVTACNSGNGIFLMLVAGKLTSEKTRLFKGWRENSRLHVIKNIWNDNCVVVLCITYTFHSRYKNKEIKKNLIT